MELPSSEGNFLASMLKRENLDHFKTKLSVMWVSAGNLNV